MTLATHSIWQMKEKLSKKLIESDDIDYSAFYNRQPLIYRLYCLPFLVIYCLWFLGVVYLLYINPDFLKNLSTEDDLTTGSMKALFSLNFWIKHEEFLLMIPLFSILICHFLTFMSGFWNVKADAFVSCKIVKGIEAAEMILVVPKEHLGSSELCNLIRNDKYSHEDQEFYFNFQNCKFFWNPERKCFSKPCYPEELKFGEYKLSRGIGSKEDSSVLFEKFGKNEFDLPMPTFIDLFKEHAVAPFFVFQIFCVGLWCLDEYWYYSLFTLVMLVVFESTVVFQRLKTLEEFRGMSIPPIDVYVHRENSNGLSEWKVIKSNLILPGDLCAIPFNPKDEEGITAPCDLVLTGGNCIVNEAMISGESTPLLKESINDCANEDTIDINNEDRNHIVFAGTKILQIHPAKPTNSVEISETGGSGVLIGYAMRTGFGTLQGKLVRTMIFSSERVSANNIEAFLFILFLLIFALAAAAYVLAKGASDPNRSRYKLLLECALIITAVVPPELPMELSLAVNNSLMELGKFAIFCMEPFRIPLAGKIDICCFDKTGTLTGENLIVEGLAGVHPKDPLQIISNVEDISDKAVKVMSICHSLFEIKNGLVAGDPMEKATLDFIDWELTTNDVVKPKNSGGTSKPKVESKSSQKSIHSFQIVHRFPFLSALKRMSVIASSKDSKNLFVGVKGAPEVIQRMLVDVPTWYESTFLKLAQSGSRVLALAYKTTNISAATFKHIERNAVEGDLHFCGFLVFKCPLKPDSKDAIALLLKSSHQVCMITGDNALTAIHTAKELEMIAKGRRVLLFDSIPQEDTNSHESIEVVDASDMKKVDSIDIKSSDPGLVLSAMRSSNCSLCFTGNAYDGLKALNSTLLLSLLPHVSIFARTSPVQKESILAQLKSPPLNLRTLMCGDGTNDVGALKQSNVGVALLDGKPEDLKKILKDMQQRMIEKQRKALEKWTKNSESTGISSQLPIEEDQPPLVKLGDASVAASFTSKISTIHSVCNIIRQGRCALVTTIQMYKILALNSLITAYSLSVLHLAGIRYGDFQVTITGILLAACFLFLTKAQPIKEMSPKRPQSNIFNWYLMSSVLFQFGLHVFVLIKIFKAAERFEFPRVVDSDDSKFVPGLLNTAVYLLSLTMQVSTFVVNYQGRPFRESLLENKPLRNSLFIVFSIAMTAAFQLFPEFNEWLELAPMPRSFQNIFIGWILIDFVGCFGIEFLAHKLFFNAKPKLEKIL